jgi:hypothetical protein
LEWRLLLTVLVEGKLCVEFDRQEPARTQGKIESHAVADGEGNEND